MTSKLLVYISREMERKLWRNNRFGGLTMNSDLDMISWKCLGHLKTSRKPLKPRWDSGVQVQMMGGDQ